jgi:hypothetical protein
MISIVTWVQNCFLKDYFNARPKMHFWRKKSCGCIWLKNSVNVLSFPLENFESQEQGSRTSGSRITYVDNFYTAYTQIKSIGSNNCFE